MSELLTRLFKNLFKAWDEFWFAPSSLLQIAVFRIALCGTLFLMYISRNGDAALYFGPDSFIPSSMTLELFQPFNRMPWAWHFWPDEWAVPLHHCFVLALGLLTLGIGGRPLTLIAWVLHMGFLYRNYSIAFGADLIGGIFLLYLVGANSCARLSLLNWIRSSKSVEAKAANSNEVTDESDLFSTYSIRLIQIQLCVIYGFTGFEKLKGGTWWDGTALWTVFANSQISAMDLTWTRQFPAVIALLTFSTILFEIYFPVLVWIKKTRPWVLTAGVLFHLGIAITLALPTFSAVMLAGYILFLPRDWIRHFLTSIDPAPANRA